MNPRQRRGVLLMGVAVLGAIAVLPLERSTERHYAKIRAVLEKQGTASK